MYFFQFFGLSPTLHWVNVSWQLSSGYSSKKSCFLLQKYFWSRTYSTQQHSDWHVVWLTIFCSRYLMWSNGLLYHLSSLSFAVLTRVSVFVFLRNTMLLHKDSSLLVEMQHWFINPFIYAFHFPFLMNNKDGIMCNLTYIAVHAEKIK